MRDWAEQVLYGQRLTDKLAPLTGVEQPPGPALARPPVFPGRPPELARAGAERLSFPRHAQLVDPRMRGQVLHFFANHELMALELMALVLLRFPDAPEPFRRGIAQILQEEQRHFTAYLNRMAELGVALGEVPASDYFWNVAADVASPMDFLCRMSLTLEQANLDFAVEYAALFRRLGDEATAAVLDQVHVDELGHVRFGLHWLRRWKDPQQSDWQAWTEHLRFPLTPNRARGNQYHPEVRAQLGFDADYIERLSVAAASKGRPSDVYWFEPACEDIVAGRAEQSARVRALKRDLEGCMLFLAGADDIVLVERAPATSFLAGLQAHGVVLPELLTQKGSLRATLGERQVRRLCPWGWTPGVDAEGLRGPPQRWSDGWRALYAKTEAARQLGRLIAELQSPRLCPPEVVGQVATDERELHAALERWSDQKMVVKGAFSASGRERVFIDGAIRPADYLWMTEALRRGQPLVVEPWLERVLDFSYQIEVGETARYLGRSRFLTTARGRYEGAVLGRFSAGLSPELLRFLQGDGAEPRWLAQVETALVRQLGGWARSLGYRGPLGVDALVYAGPDGLRLKPIVEVNPRYTFGRIALSLERRLQAGQTGFFRLVRVGELRRQGFAGGAAWAAALLDQHPLLTEGDKLVRGAFFPTDPRVATDVCTVVGVGPDLESARRAAGD